MTGRTTAGRSRSGRRTAAATATTRGASGGDAALVRQRLRNFWVVLFLARKGADGVFGDEFGRTQNGNNNPYNLNTIGMWNNWAAA